MRVYISGKIGEEVISEATRRKFAHAELVLKNRGHDPFNPADAEWEDHLHDCYPHESRQGLRKVDFYSYALLRDQMVLATYDAICLLPDWKESPGAKAELAFARATGKKIMELTAYGEIASWSSNKK